MDDEIAKDYKGIFRQYSPYTIVSDGEKTGYMIKLIDVLKRLDKINVTIIPSTDQVWGAKVNNSWNGVLGMLERNEGDFSVVPLTLSKDRFNEFSISHPFLVVRYQILFGTNETAENDIYSVVDKWIILTSLVLAVLIYIMGRLNSKYGKSKIPWIFLLQCLLGTSPNSFKCKGVARFLSVTWDLASFIVLVFVSSEMTSEFSSKSEALPFDAMEDIFHFPNAKPLLIKGGAVFSFIQKTALTSPAFAEVTKRAQANPNLCYQKRGDLSIKSRIHTGIENREQFIISSDTTQWNVIKARYAKTRICKMKLSTPLKITYRAVFFKKNISRTLIKTVNRRLRQLTEGDCFEDLDPSLNVESHPCQRTDKPDAFVVINVHAFMTIFCICLLGFSASMITLILEIYVEMLQINMIYP